MSIKIAKKLIKTITCFMLVASLFNFALNNESTVKAEDNSVVENTTTAIRPETRATITNSRTAVTDGSVSIDISGNNATDWSNPLQMEIGTIYDVLVTASFEDITSDNKELVFTLPEGLEFLQIPVVGGKYSTAGLDSKILSTMPSDDPRVSAVTNISVPTMETISGSSTQTFGTVKYSVTSDTRTIAIGFKVQVDADRFYATHVVPENMSASASKAGSSIGKVSGQIQAVGSTVGISMYRTSTATTVTQANTATESFEAIDFQNATNLSTLKSIEEHTMYIYYPQGANYVGLAPTSVSSLYTVTDDPANSRVIFSRKSDTPFSTAGSSFTITYEFPEGTAPGTYTAPAGNHATIKTYDGQVVDMPAKYTAISVKVVDELLPTLLISGRNDYVNSELDAWTNAPGFYVTNGTAVTAKNTVAHFKIEDELLAHSVVFPFDSTVNTAVLKVEYKTKNNSAWQTASAVALSSITYGTTNTSGVLEVSNLNLADGDKLTEIKFYIGDVSAGYKSASSLGSMDTVGVRTKLDNGASAGNATLTTYRDDRATETTVSATANIKDSISLNRTTSSSSSAVFRDSNNKVTGSIVAGDIFNLGGTARINLYPYGNTRTISAPEIYFYEPVGMTVAIDTLKLTDQAGNPVDYTVTKTTGTDGANVYKISTSEDILIGHFIGDNLEERFLNYDVTIATSLKLTGNYNSREMVSFGSADNVTAVNASGISAYTDQFDIDGDGSTTDTLLSHGNKLLLVQANTNVLVESFLSLDGEAPTKAYIEGDDSTVANFTPGTNADYTIKVTNNGASDVTAFTSYVPVPKTGENFGEFFQDEAFNWDTKLTGEVTTQAGFEIKYGVGVSEGDFETYSYMTYAQLLAAGHSLDDVNMVVINAVSNFTQGAEAEFVIPFNVAETFESANDGNKIGTMNVYRPAYDVDSPTYSGRLTGTKVGEELVIAEIGGMAFMDVDADGLYISANGDTVIAGHEVELYVLNETTGSYDPALDEFGNHIKTTTDSSGIYVFDYTVASYTGAIVNRTFAVRFVEVLGADVYQYTPNVYTAGSETINSDAIIANDIPNPGDTYRGWVLGIDPTSPEAKTIGVGFLKYNPPVDLKLTLSAEDREVMVGESIVVKPELIEPDFWENIKAKDGAYKWELVNAGDSQYVTLTNTSGANLGVEGVLETPEGYTVEVRLTIKDIYNTEVSDIVRIKVNPLPVPVIDASDFTLDVSEVAGLTEDKVITLGNATVIDELTGEVIEEVIYADYSNIKAEAGSYDVIYTTADGIITTVKATVGENLVVKGDLAISAGNVEMYDYEVKALQEDRGALNAEILRLSNAKAWIIETNTEVSPVIADSSAFDFSDLTPNTYTIKYNYTSPTRAGEVLDTTAKFTVKGDNTVVGDKDVIDANDFALIASEVSGLNATKVMELANARAWLLSDSSEVEIVDVDFSAIKAEQGYYDVVFTTSYGTKTTIQAFVGTTNRPIIDEENDIVIFANDYSLKDSEVDSTTIEEHIALSEAMVINQHTYEKYEITFTDVTNVVAKSGVYGATYGVDVDSNQPVDVTVTGMAVTGYSAYGLLLGLLFIGVITIFRFGFKKI